MDKQVYIITEGEYEDNCISDVLLSVPGKDMTSLLVSFQKENCYPVKFRDPISWATKQQIDNWEYRRRQLANEYGIDTIDEDDLFVEWLIRNHGFERILWDEINV